MVLGNIAKTRSSQQESTYSYASQIARKTGGQFVKLGYLLTPNRWLPRSKNHALSFSKYNKLTKHVIQNDYHDISYQLNDKAIAMHQFHSNKHCSLVKYP